VRVLALFLAALAAAIPARAEIRPVPDGLRDALAAKALLGPDLWARVVRVDNGGSRGGRPRTVYPKTVYALVFELSGILWFYCGADGTQSLSLHRGALEAEKADPGPLLRSISPGFGTWAWVEPPSGWPTPHPVSPPNACFIDCLAALRQRIAAGAEVAAPSLLSFYVDTPTGRMGHTVLVFGAGHAREAVDPIRSPVPVPLPPGLEGDPKAISRYLRGGEVAVARELPVVLPPGLGERQRLVGLPSCAGVCGASRLSAGEPAHQSLM
jgi:hypothetical protein